jgi:hypothetical protein
MKNGLMMTPGSGSIADYEAYLAEHPEDVNAWLVHADKLYGLGNPRGDYIAIYYQLQQKGLGAEQRTALLEQLAELSKDMKIDGVMPCLFIEKHAGFYRLHNVPFDGDLWVVDWTNKGIDSKGKRLEDWLEWLKKNEVLGKRNYWKLPDAYLYHAVAKAVYIALSHVDKKQRVLARKFADVAFKDILTTCTRVLYNPQGKIKLIHNYGYGGKPTVDVDYQGGSCSVKSALVTRELLKAVFGEDDKQSIIRMYEVLSGVGRAYFQLFEAERDVPDKQRRVGEVMFGRGISIRNSGGYYLFYGL